MILLTPAIPTELVELVAKSPKTNKDKQKALALARNHFADYQRTLTRALTAWYQESQDHG